MHVWTLTFAEFKKKKKKYFSTVAVLVALHHPLLMFRSSRSSRMLMDSGSPRVWVTSGWCRILKPGRHLQMSPEKKTLSVAPPLWECPAGVVSTGGFGYPDTHQLHLRLFNLTFSPSFFISFISVLLSHKLSLLFAPWWRPVDKSYWILHKPKAVSGIHEWIPVRCEHIQNNLDGSWKFFFCSFFFF